MFNSFLLHVGIQPSRGGSYWQIRCFNIFTKSICIIVKKLFSIVRDPSHKWQSMIIILDASLSISLGRSHLRLAIYFDLLYSSWIRKERWGGRINTHTHIQNLPDCLPGQTVAFGWNRMKVPEKGHYLRYSIKKLTPPLQHKKDSRRTVVLA